MNTQLAPRSRYSTTSLSKSSELDAREVAEHAARAAELVKIADHEIAQIGAHTIGTMAQLVVGAEGVQRQLTDGGVRSPVYDDSHTKILQVTGQNLITLANAGQKEIVQHAARMMR